MEKRDIARQATDGDIIRRMRFACWMTKATVSHSEYIISIAFPRQVWLSERAPLFLYMYMACPVILFLKIEMCQSSAKISTVHFG